MMKRWLNKRMTQVTSRFATKEIIMITNRSNLYGQTSKRYKQFRGNGILLLSKNDLFFELLVPRRELRIPINLITKVEKVKWFLSKSHGRPLMKVSFTNNSGFEDSVAWQIVDLDQWIKAVEQTIHSL